MLQFRDVQPEILDLANPQPASAPEVQPDPVRLELEQLKASGRSFPDAIRAIEADKEILDKDHAKALAKDVYQIT